MVKSYVQLSARGQIDRLREVVREVASREWGMEPRARLVCHAYNTTFAVSNGQDRFALRLNVASQHSLEEIEAEIAFVQYLSRAQSFSVATAVPTLDGDWVGKAPVRGIDRIVPAVLYTWLPGSDLRDKCDAEAMRALGRAMREMHLLGAAYSGPIPFRAVEDPYFGDPYRLTSADCDLPLFEETAKRATALFRKLGSRPRIPLHADLHPWNLKYNEGQLAIFDFDDAIYAWPVLDPAITLWYVRRLEKIRHFEPYLWEGLGACPDDFGVTAEEFETLVASRTLLLANFMVDQSNAGTRAQAPKFLRRCEALLGHFLDTGRFSPSEVP